MIARRRIKFRLEEARKLIRVEVRISPNKNEVPTRVWVNLKNDSEPEGYRPLTKVMSNKRMRKMLLDQALDEMEYFQRKYANLRELAAVFAEMNRAKIAIQKGVK